VFDSNAILLYLAEKTGKFLPANTPVARGEMLSWLMFVATGVGLTRGSGTFQTLCARAEGVCGATVWLRGTAALGYCERTVG